MNTIGDPAVWSALGTWATVAVLAITLFFAYRQVAEAAQLRRDQNRPFVIVSIDVEQRSLFMLAVENVGNTPAFGVVIDFDRAPQSSIKEIEHVRMLKEPIPMLPPGRKFRAFWEASHEVFADDYAYPLSYKAHVTYRDGWGHKYGPDSYILDFRIYEGQAIHLKGMHELVTSIDDLRKEHHKWTNGVKGLLVHNVDAVKRMRRQERPFHFGKVRRTFHDDGWRSAVSYWVDVLRRRYGLWTR